MCHIDDDMVLILVRKTEVPCPFEGSVRRSELRCDHKNRPVPSVEPQLICRILERCPSLTVRIFCYEMVQKDSALTLCSEIIREECMLILSMLESIIMITRAMEMRYKAINDGE